MSDTPSSASQESARNLPPGHRWLETIKRRTPEAFAAAFTKDVVLDASVLPRPIIGAADLRTFFGAARAMCDTIAFKHEVTRTYFEWEGTFQGHDVAGVTVLTKDAVGLIESIRLYHRLHVLGRRPVRVPADAALESNWSPEQITGWLKRTYPEDEHYQV
jgi:hypothetical protein